MTEIVPGATYQHYKNKKLYTLIGIALETETNEHLAIYQAQYDDPELGPKPIFARPLTMFTESVEHEGTTVPRFQKIREAH